MNKTLKLLSLSDFFILSGFSLISSILPIYINGHLIGGSILFAGLATTVLLVTRSIFQIVFSYVFQPKDRLWLLHWGSLIIALVPFGYFFSTAVWHLLIVQFAYGIGASMAYPAWNSFWSCNSEKGKKGFQWSLYNSAITAGSALTAVLGAWLAQSTDFTIVFILTGIMSLIGFVILLWIEKKALKKY
ncbi:Major Facilitator Superfamily protein [uncultured archaeon]|nr:Major Facilitator Superfamily protein [uncultured archaeon]